MQILAVVASTDVLITIGYHVEQGSGSTVVVPR